MSSFSLARSYAAAATSDASARRSGSTAATVPGMLDAGRWERRRLLEKGIAAGKINKDNLGKHDKALLTSGFGGIDLAGKRFDGKVETGDSDKSFFGFVKNLGKDIGNTALYVVPGILQAGEAAVKDTANVITGGGKRQKSHVLDEIIKPTVEGYKDTYGNGTGHFFNTFYKNPLGPILDVAAVATGGGTLAAKGGAQLTRVAEPGSTLAKVGQKGVNVTSRGGRAPLVHPLDENIQISREYTPRVIPKAYQRGVDRFIKTGDNENYLGQKVREHHQRKNARISEARTKTLLHDVAAFEVEPMYQALSKLSTEEVVALTLAQKGVNTPAKISAFQRSARESLDDPEKMLVMKNQFNMSEDFIRYQAQLPRDVKKLILAPNLNMVAAHNLWKEKVHALQEEKGYGPEITEAHIKNEADKLREYSDYDFDEPASSYPIEHTYVPSELASGFDLHQPNPRGLKGLRSKFGEGTQDAYFRRGPADSPRSIKGQRYDQSLFVPEKQRSEYRSSGETFLSGGQRIDPRLYLDHIADNARVRGETAFLRQELDKTALRDPEKHGELAEFSTTPELDEWLVKQGKKPGDAVLVNDMFPIAYFVKEQDLIKDINQVMHNFADQQGISIMDVDRSPDFQAYIEKMLNEDAQAFIKTHWGAMKRKSKAIPREEFEYRVKLAKVTEPFDNKLGRAAVQALHYWRTLTLNYMPRWALNTAAGSILMNMIRGVNYNDYRIARQLHKAGFLPEHLQTDTLKTALPTGARIGNQAVREFLEAAAPGYGNRAITMTARDMGIGFPTRKLAEGVQNIEDTFRQAQFIHNLKREAKLDKASRGRDVDVLGDQGKALIEIGNEFEQFYIDLLGPKHGGSIARALSDPKIVERTLQETDKFMYNYNILGPTERKWIRQFVPFWGWYKFISMAAYRLPVEYPGRFALLNTLSGIAEETERDHFGDLPDWLKGTIALSDPEEKDYRYLATFGLNPFSQIFNPIGANGPVGGTMSLGQLNPLLGAGLSAWGLDPMTGEQVAISPQEGGIDPFGKLRNNEGEKIMPAQAGGGRRFFMGLLRSFPEYKLVEQKLLNPMQGYGSGYPDNIPFLAPRPMGPIKEGEVGLGSLLLAATGREPKTYEDYKRKQKNDEKYGKYAMKQQQTAQRRQLKKLQNGR